MSQLTGDRDELKQHIKAVDDLKAGPHFMKRSGSGWLIRFAGHADSVTR